MSAARGSLLQVALRSFFLQAVWNFKRMQHLGFAFSIAPGLRRLYPDPQERRKAMLRHMEFFNTHPYAAPLVMGSCLRLEEGAVQRKEDPAALVSAAKAAMMGPLAAMGDAFFWATVRPLAALLAVSLAWAGGADLHWGVPLFVLLATSNLPHFLLRFVGIFRGYALGGEVAIFIRLVDVQGLLAGLKLLAMVVLGAAVASFGRFRHLASGEPMPLLDNFLFLGGGLAMLIALRLKMRPTLLLAASCLIVLVFSFFENGKP